MHPEEASSPYGLKEIELQYEERRLDATGALYVPLTEYRQSEPVTPSPLSIGTPEVCYVENRFVDALKKDEAEV